MQVVPAVGKVKEKLQDVVVKVVTFIMYHDKQIEKICIVLVQVEVEAVCKDA